jgi:hypothetical protein
MTVLAENLEKLEDSISAACRAAGRARSDVELMAVSKTYPAATIAEAAGLGLRLFGESRVHILPAVGVVPPMVLLLLPSLLPLAGPAREVIYWHWLPVPGGIGRTELGLVGALVLYGLRAVTATAAVLLYRVIELWIPAVLGIAAFVQLRRLLRQETEGIKLCKPGDTVEILGLGATTVDRSRVKSTASAMRAPAF